MNIWIDIAHMPQYNFYKPLIEILSKHGHHVLITILDRGKLVKIMQYELSEFPNVHLYVVGKHRMKKISAIIDANLIRIIKLFFWLFGKKIDFAISNNLFTPILGKLFCIPNYAFGDDPQVIDYRPKLWFSNKSHYCIYEISNKVSIDKRISILKCTKEWAYLAPKYFHPNPKVLEHYGVSPKEYVFLREVTVGTVNYAGQESGAILGVQDLIPKDKKVLFSLEEKHKRHLYPKEWILLQEPLEDIHSLIYYSAGLVSSGDSMAREAALLGVPAYYLGIRYDMPANAAAAKVANLQNQKSADFGQWVKNLSVSAQEAEEKQQALREHIDNTFIDINEYMLALVEKANK